MPKWFRSLLALTLPLSILAACGGGPESGSPVDTSIELAAVAQFCPSGEISDAIAAIFPTASALRNVATVNCGQVFDAFGKGKQTEAVQKVFAFLLKSLGQNEAGKLLVSGPSGEVDVTELAILMLTEIGVDLPPMDPEDLADAVSNGEVVSGTLVPGGPPVITPSKHAGIDDGGGLTAPVTVVIIMIPPDESEIELSSLSHPCPAGVDNSFDCYPLFFDYSVSPESNVDPDIGLQLGQCNVSPEGVEVELLSPEGFLPLDAAPAGLDCTDVEPEEITMTGWRSYAWAALEPLSPLLRVTPAFAGQSPIGGRISNFSPVAPADPESGVTLGSISGQVTDTSTESSIQGATVDLFTDAGETFVNTTETNADGNYFFSDLDLGTYTVEASATGYESGGAGPVELTTGSPDAENVDIGLDPIVIP